MTFVWPWAFWFFLVSAAIVALYLIRRERKRLVVPSLALWARVAGPRHRYRLASRLRRILSLLLQLILLTIIIFAVANPVRQGAAPRNRTFLILIDTSPSMTTMEGGRTRLEAAKKRAAELIDRMGPLDKAAIFEAAGVVRPIQRPTADRARLLAALDAMEPSGVYADLPTCLGVLDELAGEWTNPLLFVITDGAEEGFAEALERTGAAVLPIRSESAASPLPAAPDKARPLAVRIVTASALPLDLMKSLLVLPEYVDAKMITTQKPDVPIEMDADRTVAIFYEAVPVGPLPDGHYLFINPPGGPLPYAVGPRVSRTFEWEKNPKARLGKGVDFRLLNGRTPALPSRGGEGTAVLTTSHGPVIASGQQGGVQYVHVGFSIEKSNFAHLVAFPLFFKNVWQHFHALANDVPETDDSRERRVAPLSIKASSLPPRGVDPSNPLSNLWAALALAAVALSLLEWFLYQRRVTE